MGLIVGCLRGVYHRFGPYFNRRIQVQPNSSVSHENTTATGRSPVINNTLINTSYEQRPLNTPFCSREYEEEQLEIQWKELCNTPIKSRSVICTGDTVYCCVIANWNEVTQERHIIKEEVITKVTQWCNDRQIHFIYSDLQEENHGKDHSIEMLKLSIHELERIINSGCVVLIVVLLSDEIGWIPPTSTNNRINKWWPKGMSVLEMELIKGVFTVTNNDDNVLFMFRETIDRHYSSNITSTRMKYLQNKIKSTYKKHIFTYSLTTNEPQSSSDKTLFTQRIQDFIINKILSIFSANHPVSSLLQLQNEYQLKEFEKYSYPSTINHKNHVLSKIHLYINSDSYSSPLLLIGEVGSGRSTLLTTIIQHYNVNSSPISSSINNHSFTLHKEKLLTTDFLQSETTSDWHVFYHYVGKYPYSADLRHILQRVWSIPSLPQPRPQCIKNDSNSLAKEVLQLLSTRSERKTLLIIDSIDKIRDEHSSHILKWLPASLPPNIKLIVSLRPNSIARKVFMSRDPKCIEVSIGSISLVDSRKLITKCLQNDNIFPNTGLVNALLDKLNNCNPLYVHEAASYLSRHKVVQGNDDRLISLALSLPDSLSKLHQKSIVDLETGTQGRYIIAALCLIHCSHYGLLESELISLLSALTDSEFHTQQTNEIFDFTLPHVPNDITSCDNSPKRDTKVWGDYLTVTPPLPLVAVRRHSATLPVTRIRTNSFSLSDDEYHANSCSKEENSFFLYPKQTYKSSVHSLTPEGSPLFSQPTLLPSLKVTSSISLLSTADPTASSKNTGTVKVSQYINNQGIVLADTEDKIEPPKTSLLVGLKRINMNMSPCNWKPLSSHIIASIMKQLEPFLKDTGQLAERRYSLKDSSFSAAVHERYFANAPTKSFPFSFCTSPLFFGADKDQTYFSLMSEVTRSTHSEESDGGSQRSFHATNRSPHTVRRSPIEIDVVYKRYSWWHARLAGYFSSTAINETRRSEELPYHLSYINDTGNLSHSLVHLPLFEILYTDDTVIDLIHYWHCTGGYCSIGELYEHSLNETSLQEGTVTIELVNKVTMFLCQVEQHEIAKHILNKRIELEENKTFNDDTLTELMFTLTQVYHHSLITKECTSSEEEYNLICVAGRCVQLYRSTSYLSRQENLSHVLLILGQHLLTYSQLGGERNLSSMDALTQAQEATQEAKEIYTLLEDSYFEYKACLQLSSVYKSHPSKAIEYLQKAKELVMTQYGSKCPLMIRVLQEMSYVYSHLLFNKDMGEKYNKECSELTNWLYGKAAYHIEKAGQRTVINEQFLLDKTDIVTIIAEIAP